MLCSKLRMAGVELKETFFLLKNVKVKKKVKKNYSSKTRFLSPLPLSLTLLTAAAASPSPSSPPRSPGGSGSGGCAGRRPGAAASGQRPAQRRPPGGLRGRGPTIRKGGSRRRRRRRRRPPLPRPPPLFSLPLRPLPPRGDHGPELARDGLVGPPLEGDDVGGDLGQVLFFWCFFFHFFLNGGVRVGEIPDFFSFSISLSFSPKKKKKNMATNSPSTPTR